MNYFQEHQVISSKDDNTSIWSKITFYMYIVLSANYSRSSPRLSCGRRLRYPAVLFIGETKSRHIKMHRTGYKTRDTAGVESFTRGVACCIYRATTASKTDRWPVRRFSDFKCPHWISATASHSGMSRRGTECKSIYSFYETWSSLCKRWALSEIHIED